MNNINKMNIPGNVEPIKADEEMTTPESKEKLLLEFTRNLRENYAGVCDVTNPEHVRAMLEIFRQARKNNDRKLMVGVMVHPVMLDPHYPVPENIRQEMLNEFPKFEDIYEGFIDDPDVLNTLHYADLYGDKGPRKAEECQNVLRNLELLVSEGEKRNKRLDAIQLDLTWPNPSEIKEFKERHPEIVLILQVGKYAINEVGGKPEAIVNKLREYGYAIDHVLLDMSLGKGVAMESEGLLPTLRVIRKELHHLGLAVAGGMGPGSMEPLRPVAEEFPGIAIDAQGNIKPDDAPRDPLGHLMASTEASLPKSKQYIEESLVMLDNPKSN